MTVEEFLNKTENMVIVDYDLDKETGYVEVKFGRNTGGSINYVFENNGVIILSSTPKDSNPKWYETAHQLDLSEIRDFCKGYENLELYYYSKSNGIFPVESVRRIEYNYSDDGDGHYEACHIECSENPVAKSLDNIEKINVDDYEDFFESLNKFNESHLKEDISESKTETLSDSLKKISEWIGSVWELKELPKGAWRTDKPRYKIRGFEVYPKGIYVKFSFADKDDDGHVYEDSLEDWLSKRHFIKAK